MRSHRNCTNLQQLWISINRGYFHVTFLLVGCIFRNLRSLTANRHLLRAQITLFARDFYSKMFALKSLCAQEYLMRTGISTSARTADLGDTHQKGGQESENTCQLHYLPRSSRMDGCASHECCPPTCATAPQQGGTQGQFGLCNQRFDLFFVMVIKRQSWKMSMWRFFFPRTLQILLWEWGRGGRKRLHQARNASTSPWVGNTAIH